MSGCGAVVRRERWHSRRRFAGAHLRSPSAGRRRGGVVVGGGGLVGRMVNEALEARLRWGSGAPHHHCDFIGTASATRESDDRVKSRSLEFKTPPSLQSLFYWNGFWRPYVRKTNTPVGHFGVFGAHYLMAWAKSAHFHCSTGWPLSCRRVSNCCRPAWSAGPPARVQRQTQSRVTPSKVPAANLCTKLVSSRFRQLWNRIIL